MKLVFLFVVMVTSYTNGVSAFPKQFCYSYTLAEHQCDTDEHVQIIEIPTAASTCDSKDLADKIGVKTETEVGKITTDISELSTTVLKEAKGLEDKIQSVGSKLNDLSDTKIKGIEGNIQTLTTKLNEVSDTKIKNLEKKLDLLLSPCAKPTFKVTPGYGNYAQVKKMCEELGGTLLASPFLPGGKRYEKRIVAIVKAVVDSRWFYVGLTDDAVEGEFRLPDGRLFNSADISQMGNWGEGQPNNAGRGEDAVILYKFTNRLYDRDAATMFYGICEIRVYEC